MLGRYGIDDAHSQATGFPDGRSDPVRPFFTLITLAHTDNHAKPAAIQRCLRGVLIKNYSAPLSTKTMHKVSAYDTTIHNVYCDDNVTLFNEYRVRSAGQSGGLTACAGD